MTRTAALALTLAAGFATQALSAQPLKIKLEPFEEKPAVVEREIDGPVIQLAICLDTSGSMGGLINQARTRIWSVVNELDSATLNGEKPTLEVALYQYGSTHQSGSEGFIGCVLPFTSDLDRISEALFALQISGSAEYCGMAVQRATQELAWLPKTDETLKVIVIAGNEHFRQGPVNYEQSVPNAVEYGITINTVHCGTDHEGRNGGWLHAAQLGGGEYNIIDHNRDFIEIRCPQDERLRELNVQLNGTYLYYGIEGEDARMRQARADTQNEEASGMALARRIASKASSQYRNSHWDLIDASEDDDFELEDVDKSTLPAELQEASTEEIEAKIAEYGAKRAELQAEIAKLSTEREAWLAKERKRLGEEQGESLDSALVLALRAQAEAQGFKFED